MRLCPMRRDDVLRQNPSITTGVLIGAVYVKHAVCEFVSKRQNLYV